MLRALFLYLSRAEWAKKIALKWKLARRVALRFVAGETLADAVTAIRRLNEKGTLVTADILGESVTDVEEARRNTALYFELFEALKEHNLNSWVSLKLTALGLDIDPDLCYRHMCDILSVANERGIMVTIDMEDHPYTDRTLEIFRRLRADGYQNVRTVIQAYLYRSDEDIRQLAEEGAGIRLCKGAYKEPPQIAYPKKSDVDAAYIRQVQVLLDAAQEGRGYPGIATHDENMIAAAKSHAASRNIPRDRFEFQMLYGVRTALQEQLAADGYRMRVYVPYGTQWYPYLVRRLAERPANVWFFISTLVRK